jgi:hypothetical protein
MNKRFFRCLTVEHDWLGDFNHADGVNLTDAILVAKILTGQTVTPFYIDAAGPDSIATLADFICILRKTAEG